MPDTILPRDGLVIVAKRDCPTCVLVEPVMQSLDRAGPLAVVSQDDPTFPSGVRSVLYDDALERSFRLNIEAVPTLIRFKDGREVERTVGWERKEWMRLAGDAAEGKGLPAWQPGCGSKSVEPGVHEALIARYGDPGLKSREIAVGNWDDPMEACFERGWTDGLPVVPPTDERILRMLGGTHRKPDEVVGLIPPNLASCTVEKVAINAVMAGCKPEYMPVVLGVLEAALDPLFVLHGLLCTTHFSGPLVIINGPAAKAIGMNSGVNALGQGNRANATIGRALQLIVQERRRRPARRHRSRDLGQSRQVHLLLRRGRVRSRLGAAVGAPRHRAGQERRHLVPWRGRARLHRPEIAHARGAGALAGHGPVRRRPPEALRCRQRRAGAVARALQDLQGRRLEPPPHRGRAVRRC